MDKKGLVSYRNHTSFIQNFVPFPAAICTIVLISAKPPLNLVSGSWWITQGTQNKKWNYNELEEIIDYGSAFVTNGNEIKSKGEISGFVLQENQD